MENKKIFFGLSAKKSIILIILAAFAGIMLIGLSSRIGTVTDSKNIPETELERFIRGTEERLCKAISGIKGAGQTEVFLSVENTFETVYASNASIDESGDELKKNKTTQKELALTNADGTQKPVIVKQLCPKISGVLVVCEGGENPVTREEIIKSVSIAVGISASKIYVTGGKVQ